MEALNIEADSENVVHSHVQQKYCKREIIFLFLLCVIGALGFIGFLLRFSHTEMSPEMKEELKAIPQTDALFQEFADKHIFSGVVAIAKQGSLVFHRAYGDASVGLGVAMNKFFRFPCGSHANFFVAVAVYQLAAQRDESGTPVLDVNAELSKYIDAQDVGLEEKHLLKGKWCPRSHSDGLQDHDVAPCQSLTLRHLLMMSSGIVDPRTRYQKLTWQQRYDVWNHSYTLTDWKHILEGNVSVAGQLRTSRVFQTPLKFVPGSAFEFTQINYLIASYVVERVAKMPLKQFLMEKIIKPLALHRTAYDPTVGGAGVHEDSLEGLSYKAIFNSEGVYTKTIAFRDAFETLLSASEEGGLLSTASDMVRWYLNFYSNFEKLGISQKAIDKMLKPKVFAQRGPLDTKLQGFAQGIFVNKNRNDEVYASGYNSWPAPIWYVGGLGFATVSMAMWPNNDTRSESDVVAIFSNLGIEVSHCDYTDWGQHSESASSQSSQSGIEAKGCKCAEQTPGSEVESSPTILCKLLEQGGFWRYVHRELISIWDIGKFRRG